MRHAVKASPRHSGASRDVKQCIIKTLSTDVSMHHQRHCLHMSHCIIKTAVSLHHQDRCQDAGAAAVQHPRMHHQDMVTHVKTSSHGYQREMHQKSAPCKMRRMHRRGTAFDDTKETSDGPTRQSVAWNPLQSMYTLRRARRWSSGERCAGSASEPCEAHAMPWRVLYMSSTGTAPTSLACACPWLPAPPRAPRRAPRPPCAPRVAAARVRLSPASSCCCCCGVGGGGTAACGRA